MENEMETPLLFDNRGHSLPRRINARDELIVVEMPAIEWRDAGITAPLEVLLAGNGGSSIFSTALVRPIGRPDWCHVTLGTHRQSGPHLWLGGGQFFGDEAPLRRRLRRVLPSLLRRRLWGRELWLDTELNIRHHEAPFHLYLGANGIGEWQLFGDPRHYDSRAAFEWGTSDESEVLLRLSDDELLAHIVAQTRRADSDAAFALQWVSWGWNDEAWNERRLLALRTARDSMAQMQWFLERALCCEPEFFAAQSLRWELDPCGNPAQFYGEPARWREPLESDWGRGEMLYRDPNHTAHLRLPPFSRRLRDWAGEWFGASPNQPLIERHRCLNQIEPFNATVVVAREQLPTAHEQLEACAQLRDFLGARVAPDELETLLKLD